MLARIFLALYRHLHVVFLKKKLFFYPEKYTKIPLDSDVLIIFYRSKNWPFLECELPQAIHFFLLKNHVKKHNSPQVAGANARCELFPTDREWAIFADERTNGPFLVV
jgi:hypothetical protein